jgi:hypothetical protein
LDFFDPNEGRYEYRPNEDSEKYGRKMLAARRLRSFMFGFAFLDASDTSVSEASPNANFIKE